MRVLRFVTQRLLLLVPVLLGISIVTFVMTRVLPGDPTYLILGPQSTVEQQAAVRAQHGLDQPLVTQYVDYLGGLLRGDLGSSYRSRQPVADELPDRFMATFELTTISLVVACAVGVPLGVAAAARRNGPVDHASRVLSIAGVSVPIFFSSALLIYFVYYRLGWAPAPLGRFPPRMAKPREVTGMATVDSLLDGRWDAFTAALRQLLLPVTALAFAMTAPIVRLTRNSMIDALGSRFVQTATAFGLPRRTVLFRDALRNALLPIITGIGLVYGWSLGGEFLIEVMFSWPGLGTYAVDSILAQDFAPVQAVVLVTATVYVVVNLIVDLLYFAFDPRVQVSS